jgi:cyclic pyranopterin phosphate synthase
MIDGYGRTIDYLRISVTDRCNLRCVYCMPEDGMQSVSHSDILTYEELLRLANIFASLGVRRVRLTGGEPLVRKGLPFLVKGLKELPGIEEVALTTNGILLSEQLPALCAAGLNAVNVSLDTLEERQFEQITRRKGLTQALCGLEAAVDAPGLRVKVNCVPTADNQDQWVPLAALARERALDVRFIEMMPIGLGKDCDGQCEEQVRARLEEAFGTPLPCAQNGGMGPGRYVTFPGFLGRVGFISAVSHQFCADCNRIRLTAAGFLKTCLQYQSGVDLRTLLREGADDERLREAILFAVAQKPAGHHFGAPGRLEDEGSNMNEIGG